jgi:hypothetical protein
MSVNSRAFSRRATRIIASQGNQPGFPNQFAERNIPQQSTRGEGALPNVTPEAISIVTNGARTIKQSWVDKSIIGNRGELLPKDLPFDYRQQERKESYMGLMGFSLILVGIFLYYR